MTFADIVAILSTEIGATIEMEKDTCALRAGGSNKSSVTILVQGLDVRGAMLMTADLGAPPPERLERLYRALLEANDLFRDTGGATSKTSRTKNSTRHPCFPKILRTP